ncbi:MAG TPA: DNA-processing protein DprA [Polyangia bacterium]|jgi:DNA processing protein|nr:DNA-processing protein DprA [Polyangia bacterium]
MYNLERGQPDYPPEIASLPRAPAGLWVRGAWPLSGRRVSLVGARAATQAGLRLAREVARGLGSRGCTVISGGAIGIDGAAHLGALDVRARTAVVLGTGVDVAYPARHRSLFERVLATGGTLLSQFPPGSPPRPWAFPVRNRVIAALGEVCVVIEAGAGSGALYTACAARDLGRPVIALLGAPGCDRLIAEGAVSARGVEDVLRLVDGIDVATSDKERDKERDEGTEAPVQGRAAQLFRVLGREPCDLSEAAARAGLDAGAAMAAAIDLEIGGWIVRTAGGRYARVTG